MLMLCLCLTVGLGMQPVEATLTWGSVAEAQPQARPDDPGV